MVKKAKANLMKVCDITEEMQIKYGVSFWLLQERACFTFKEATVFLAPYRDESIEDLAKRFKVSKKKIKKIRKSAYKKLEMFGGRKRVLMGYDPPIVTFEPPSADMCCMMRKKGMSVPVLDHKPLF